MSSLPDRAYDVSVSYAETDRAWVEGYPLDALGAAGVHAHSEAAFRLGALRLREFEQAMQGSQRILLVLGMSFFADAVQDALNPRRVHAAAKTI
jgi:hypothetical protein